MCQYEREEWVKVNHPHLDFGRDGNAAILDEFIKQEKALENNNDRKIRRMNDAINSREEFLDVVDATEKIVNIPTVYIAGAFRNKNGEYSVGNDGVKDNINHAIGVAKILFENGIFAMCPHANTNFDVKIRDKKMVQPIYLGGDLKLLMACDALLVCRTYQESDGSHFEINFAKMLGMPIFYEDQDGIEKLIANKDDLVKYDKQFLMFRLLQAFGYFLHVRKNLDYSPMNMKGTGLVGGVTRLWDKCARILNLVGFNIQTGEYNKPRNPKNESLEDSFADLSNYALINFILSKNMWGK